MKRRGLLIILSSPSGAGKSTLARRLRDWDPGIRFSVSATTRPAREGEVDGVEYHFVDAAEFARMVKQGELLEYATVFGNDYGSPLQPILEAIDAGQDILFDVDWQGAQQIATSERAPQLLSIFLLPPSIRELRHRLESRGQDTDETIQDRMARSWDEISHWGGYDYVLVNDDLDATESKLKAIVTAERLRRAQQPWLQEHVRKLQREFEEGA